MLGVFQFSCPSPCRTGKNAIQKHLPEKLWKLNMTAFAAAERKSKMFMSEKVRKNMETGSWIRKMFDEATS